MRTVTCDAYGVSEESLKMNFHVKYTDFNVTYGGGALRH